MADFLKGLRLGSIVLEQTSAWQREPSTFQDTIVVTVSDNVGVAREYVSLDELVAFVTTARDEWRQGYDATHATPRPRRIS